MPRTIIQQPSCWAVETCIQISTPKGSLTPEDVEARQSPSFRAFFPFQVHLSSPRVLARIPKSDDDNVLPSFQNQQLKRMQPYSLTMFTPDACLAHPPIHPQLISDSRLEVSSHVKFLNSVGSRTDQPHSARSSDFLEDA